MTALKWISHSLGYADHVEQHELNIGLLQNEGGKNLFSDSVLCNFVDIRRTHAHTHSHTACFLLLYLLIVLANTRGCTLHGIEAYTNGTTYNGELQYVYTYSSGICPRSNEPSFPPLVCSPSTYIVRSFQKQALKSY